MTNLEAALSYLRRGWSVFPLLPRSKTPAMPWATFQTERMDEEWARAHWEVNPNNGVAIVTGAISGLVVIDVDPRNGGDIGALEGIGLWKIGASTGGGGLHVLCRHPGGHIPCGKTSKPGIDRKADGGYIVAPPSIHPSGKPYAWIVSPAEGELAELPSWVLEAPASTSLDGDPHEPWVAEVLERPDLVRPGTQEETLTKLCWWASGHLDEDIALSVLARWAFDLPLGNPNDPWMLEHVKTRLDTAYAKRAQAPQAVTARLQDDTRAGIERFRRVSELEFPAQDWIVEDFAAPGAFTEIIGKVKKGKSTLTYQLVNAVRLGEPFLGRATKQGGAVILTEQTGTSLKKTLERAGLLGARDVYVLRKQDIKDVGGWSAAVSLATDLCLRESIGLLVVDTLSRLAGLLGDAENKSGAVSVLDPFVRARDAGVACVFVRHARKGQSGEADDIADAARGSSAITGDMDVVLRLTPAGDGDLRCLSWESRITDDPEDVYLEYIDGVYTVVDRPDTKTERRRDERLDKMRDALAAGITGRNELARHLGWSEKTVTKYRRWAEEGQDLPAPPAGEVVP